MLAPPVSSSRILKVSTGVVSETDDLLAAEEPLEIRLGYSDNGVRFRKSISVTMRTPGNDFELALGFLFTEGVIKKYEDVSLVKYCTDSQEGNNGENSVRVELQEDVRVDLEKLHRNFYTTSSCGVCGKTSIEAVDAIKPATVRDQHLSVSSAFILSLPHKLREKQKVFEYTGGLHASALFDANGNSLFIREDVGRHNALDKLIGAALVKNLIPLNRHILMLSGRASFELIQKTAMAGICLAAAVGAPSGLAVESAKQFGITLIGFLREHRFNIYSCPERIQL